MALLTFTPSWNILPDYDHINCTNLRNNIHLELGLLLRLGIVSRSKAKQTLWLVSVNLCDGLTTVLVDVLSLLDI